MDMKWFPLHCILLLLIGYALGVYWPGPGASVRAKLGV